MQAFIKNNLIAVLILIVGILITLGISLTFYNRRAMETAVLLKIQSQSIKTETERTYDNIRYMDISIRGYALTKEPAFLFYSVEQAKTDRFVVFHALDSLLRKQGYQDEENYANLKKGMDEYVNVYQEMVNFIRRDSMTQFFKLFRHDYGKYYWLTYDKFASPLFSYERALNERAEKTYANAALRNSIVQILMFIIGLPTLVILYFKLRKDALTQKQISLKLDNTNRKYLFDSGGLTDTDPLSIMESSIVNLQNAANFITEISNGNYDAMWTALTDSNAKLNTENLVGRLISMKEHMKKMKQLDDIRFWMGEGLSNLSDISRKYQNNTDDLCYQGLVFIVKYLSAQQGGIFLVQGNDSTERYLELVACFAYNRKKFLQKRIEVGEGLVGQIYLEKKTIIMTEVPSGYTYVTSGLGDATARCIALSPMIYNNDVVGVIEIASLKKLKDHEITFLEKSAEQFGATLSNVYSAEKTKTLLNKIMQQNEDLQSQSEELRQNMEELEATQEEMKRRESGSQK
jgi:hypothetical protein